MDSILTFDDEFREFEDSTLYMSEDEERKVRIKFSKRIKEIIKKFPNNPDYYHKLGLCLYNINNWLPEDRNTIETSFQRALLLDADSFLSRMFLVHFYFDIGEYYLSIRSYEKFPENISYLNIPNWRLIKLREINLCCSIYLDLFSHNELINSLENIITTYEKLNTEDLADAEPSDLLLAISTNSTLNSFEKKVSKFIDIDIDA